MTTWTPQNFNGSVWVPSSKGAGTAYLLREELGRILLEDGGKIVISDETSWSTSTKESSSWSFQAEN